MTQLDEHGARIIGFIESYQHLHHRSPSYEEIGAAVGIASKDHVSRDLRRLVKQGYLSLTPRVGRSIVLLKTKSQSSDRPSVLPLPIAGTLGANTGLPDPRPQNRVLDWLDMGRALVDGQEDVFVVRVEGNSMVDALVSDGDFVVLKRQEVARNGEMVAVWEKPNARLGLKYFFRENGHVRLQPANRSLPAVYLKPDEVEVKGQVLAIVRKTNQQT